MAFVAPGRSGKDSNCTPSLAKPWAARPFAAPGSPTRSPARPTPAAEGQRSSAPRESARLDGEVAKRPALDVDGARRRLLAAQQVEREAERKLHGTRDAERAAALALQQHLARQDETDTQRKTLRSYEQELRDWSALVD